MPLPIAKSPPIYAVFNQSSIDQCKCLKVLTILNVLNHINYYLKYVKVNRDLFHFTCFTFRASMSINSKVINVNSIEYLNFIFITKCSIVNDLFY